MKIVLRPIGSITPYDKNPRHHPEAQVEALAKAIQEFGFDQPIVVDPQGVIIKGHGRYMAALLLKLKEVPVVEKAVTENEARLLRIADNEQVSKDWDYHALKQETDELVGGGMELETIGFTVEALAELDIPEQVPPTKAPDNGVRATTHTCKHCGYHF